MKSHDMPSVQHQMAAYLSSPHEAICSNGLDTAIALNESRWFRICHSSWPTSFGCVDMATTFPCWNPNKMYPSPNHLCCNNEPYLCWNPSSAGLSGSGKWYKYSVFFPMIMLIYMWLQLPKWKYQIRNSYDEKNVDLAHSWMLYRIFTRNTFISFNFSKTHVTWHISQLNHTQWIAIFGA